MTFGKKEKEEMTAKHEQEIADLKAEHETSIEGLNSKVSEHEKTVLTLDEKNKVLENENKTLKKENKVLDEKQKEIAVENFETGKQLTAAQVEIAKLKQADGDVSTVTTKVTDAVEKTTGIVSSDDDSLEENIKKVGDAYLA